MPFPSSETPGYTSLTGRINTSLDRLQEEQWLDFKRSATWDKLKWSMTRSAMAMANLRDGGILVVGMKQDDNTWEVEGVSESDLASFDYECMRDHFAKYASPDVVFDAITHCYQRNELLVLVVRPFSVSPVVCRCNSPEDLPANQKLRSGEIYVRPGAGRPRTVRADDASLLHELLEMATEARTRQLIETMHRVGGPIQESPRLRYEGENEDLGLAILTSAASRPKVRVGLNW